MSDQIANPFRVGQRVLHRPTSVQGTLIRMDWDGISWILVLQPEGSPDRPEILGRLSDFSALPADGSAPKT